MEWQKSCDLRNIICLDESGVKTNFTPLRGWAPKGERCIGKAPGKWKSHTVLSYLTYEGITGSHIFPCAVNKEIFKEFMEEVLLPIVKDENVIIMDNLNVHKISFNKSLFEKKGVEIKFLPRYSPEFNPIEMMWSKMKSDLRKVEPRDFYDVWREASCSLLDVTDEMAKNWHHACGYSQ